MKEAIKWTVNRMPKSDDRQLGVMSLPSVAKARFFHSSFPQYSITPLAELDGMAKYLGLGGLYVKNEAHRFGLNAFKVLGGSFAMARYIAGELGRDVSEMTYDYLTSQDFQSAFGQATFFTATDGNHGRGVAWAARELGQKAVVHMPAGTVAERLENIRALGAQADILPMNYDEAVRRSAQEAEEKGYVLIQDTAWPGYEEIPACIMEGYATLAWEIEEALTRQDGEKPTHLFLQAGVGSLAGAVAAYFAARWGAQSPQVIVVEPEAADCHFRTAAADDGTLHAVTGAMNSTMAGLCCGEVNVLSWPLLRAAASAFLSCSDGVTEEGMRLLGRPGPGDPAIVSGESGAVTAGALAALMTDPALAQARTALGLDAGARVLLISTEGDTDRVHYQAVLQG